MVDRQGQATPRGKFRAVKLPAPADIPESERTPDADPKPQPTNADRLNALCMRVGYTDQITRRHWGHDVTVKDLRLRDPDHADAIVGDDDDIVRIGQAPYTIQQRGGRTIVSLHEQYVRDDDPDLARDPIEYVGIGATMTDAITDLETQVTAREESDHDAK